MRNFAKLIGGGVLACAVGSTALAQWSPLQAEDRGGPRYTTGNTMGRGGVQSGASTDPAETMRRSETTSSPSEPSRGEVASEPRVGRERRNARKPVRERPLRAKSGTPGLGKRGTETTEGGAGTTGGSGPDAAGTGH
jgi:hypothetical protein